MRVPRAIGAAVLLVAILGVPLDPAGGDAGAPGLAAPEVELPHRQPRHARIAQHAHVQFAPFDELLDQHVGLVLLEHELDALTQVRRVVHHRGLRYPQRCVVSGGFHEQRIAQLARHLQALAATEHRELRGGDAMEGEHLLTQGLVARQQQAARIAAGIGLAQHFQEGDDMLVVADDTVEFLQQVEDDVRLPVGDGAAQFGKTVEHAQRAHFMPGLAQCLDHVVFSAPLVHRLGVMSFEAVRRHQARMQHYQYAQAFHRCSLGRAPRSRVRTMPPSNQRTCGSVARSLRRRRRSSSAQRLMAMRSNW